MEGKGIALLLSISYIIEMLRLGVSGGGILSRKEITNELIGRVCRDCRDNLIPPNSSTDDLARRYKVAKNTMLGALRILRDCGVVSLRQGQKVVFKPTAGGVPRPQDTKVDKPLSAASVVAREILHGIEFGRYRPGKTLPKTLFFCDKHGASSHTVISALRILESRNAVHKSGQKWVVGKRKPSVRPKLGFHQVITVIQQSPQAFGKLCADPFWYPFAENFLNEADSEGIGIQPVIFDEKYKELGSLSGIRDYSSYVAGLGDRHLGTLALPPDDLTHSEKTKEWLRCCSQKAKNVVWLCTPSDWLRIEKDVSDLSNVSLALVGEWKPDETHRSPAALAIDTLRELGHTRILSIDTIVPREEWVVWRIRNLYRHVRRIGETIQYTHVGRSGLSEHTEALCENDKKLFLSVKVLKEPALERLAGRLLDRRDPGFGDGSDKDFVRHVLSDSLILIPAYRNFSPTAIIALNDTRAQRHHALFQTLGISVPRDISLISFDNSAHLRPDPISSIDLGLGPLGYKSLHYLLDDIPVHTIQKRLWIEPFLRDRGSISAPKKKWGS